MKTVERGAEFLDEHYPGWLDLIDTETLDLSSCSKCVLGQLYLAEHPRTQRREDAYGRKCSELGIGYGEAGPAPATLGFAAFGRTKYETLSLRFGWSKKPWTPENAGENVVLHPKRLEKPSTWREPRMVFVNSMSDLFHELVPFEYVDRVFETMATADQHTYQVLTKRPDRMREYMLRGDSQCEPLPNVWLGTSIESAQYAWRANILRDTPAAVRFVSAEPLLGSLFNGGRDHWHLDLAGIQWLIAGGESGNGFRACSPDWVRELRDACATSGTAFFFKQWGGRTPKSGGRVLDGREWSEYPKEARP